MLFTVALWLHLIGAVIWIGGMLFLVTVLRPAVMGAQNTSFSLPQEKASFLNAVHTRFRTLVGIMIALLIVTGAVNISRYLPLLSAGIATSTAIVLWVKLALATGLFTIYTINVLASRKALDPHCIDKPTPQKMKFQLAAIIMAVGILFCSAILRG